MVSTCNKSIVAQMNRRIELQEVVRESDGQGGFTEGWTPIATVWAKIEPIKAYEKFQAAQMQTPVTHKIMVRYHSGITTACRILYDGRIFDIKEVVNVDEAGAFMRLTVVEN